MDYKEDLQHWITLSKASIYDYILFYEIYISTKTMDMLINSISIWGLKEQKVAWDL